ncbi:hypothetical protein ACS5PU_02240 [Pedobacter sp. GSP4]|uniref:hypothetical protein n=1 Tax=Pedobacter sp. GSP4 TaxID=3453716 RepID=UPI003EEE52A6
MKTNIFKSYRYFTTFDIKISHGQLLLRSQKNENYSHNIDVIFFNTVYMQLFNRLNGICIEIADENKILEYDSVSSYLSSENNYLFEITSGLEKYYVAASFVKVFENELDFNETSLTFGNEGKTKEIATSLID